MQVSSVTIFIHCLVLILVPCIGSKFLLKDVIFLLETYEVNKIFLTSNITLFLEVLWYTYTVILNVAE